MPYTILVTAPASESATNQYLAPFAGAAMGEWFMDNGMDALIVFDDLSKHAVAYRQVSLVLKRPSGREALSRRRVLPPLPLLERSARVNEKNGNGSLTALPIIETRRATSPPTSRPTSSRLQTARFTWKPTSSTRASVPRFRSVSRSAASVPPRKIKAIKQVAGKIKGDLAQFRELAAFAQFGSDLDAKTKAQLDRGQRIVELFKQKQYNPLPVEQQVAVLWAMQNGYFDEVPWTG